MHKTEDKQNFIDSYWSFDKKTGMMEDWWLVPADYLITIRFVLLDKQRNHWNFKRNFRWPKVVKLNDLPNVKKGISILCTLQCYIQLMIFFDIRNGFCSGLFEKALQHTIPFCIARTLSWQKGTSARQTGRNAKVKVVFMISSVLCKVQKWKTLNCFWE